MDLSSVASEFSEVISSVNYWWGVVTSVLILFVVQ